MSYWNINIYLESYKNCSVKLPKVSPTEIVTDVIDRICNVNFPAFENPDGSFIVVNTQKIVKMEIKEVEVDDEAI